jgi:ubiquinone/menaquinone biosynthesis C-methylase UbiE
MNSLGHERRTVKVAQMLLERVSLPAQPVCLEVGCGQGALARLLAKEYNARVVATDYDPAQVGAARRRLAGVQERVELRVMDARVMVFDDARFDGVFSFGVLHHITRGWQDAVGEIARVLRPGGWYIFTDLLAPSRMGRLARWLLLRFGLLEEAALRACLIENGLTMDYSAMGRGLGGPAGTFMGIARKLAGAGQATGARLNATGA